MTAQLRAATDKDREGIRGLYHAAFPAAEWRPVATLALALMEEKSTPETLSLVAEADGEVVGHIAFSPVTDAANKAWQGYILAPLAVQPAYQKCRIGSALIKAGIEHLSNNGVDVLFVYGDPNYYGKFGFDAKTASGYSPVYKLEYPFAWQAIRLTQGMTAEHQGVISCVGPLNNQRLW